MSAFIILQITGNNQIELKEGTKGSIFGISFTAPPYVLCRERQLSVSDNCSIGLKSILSSSDNNVLTCPNGSISEQVVSRIISRDDSSTNPGAYCRVMVTNDNWEAAQFNLEVKATSDNKYDGDFDREMLLQADYYVNDIVEQANVTKKNVQVN